MRSRSWRKGGRTGGHLEYDQTLNQLLSRWTASGLTRVRSCGRATNRPDLLDKRHTEAGTLRQAGQVDLPDKDGRMEILKLHLRNKPLAPGVEMDQLAQETFGLSGAHLESLCNEAAIHALRRGAEHIDRDDLEEALDKVLMGEKLERRPSKDEVHRIAVHEAGHAIVTETLRPGTVAQVTVSPRGNALGFVRHNPKDDMYVYPREVLEDEISVLVAGALAEDLVLGSRSTGASKEFERDMEMDKRIVSYGMSPLGVVDRDTASPDALAKEPGRSLKRARRCLPGS